MSVLAVELSPTWFALGAIFLTVLLLRALRQSQHDRDAPRPCPPDEKPPPIGRPPLSALAHEFSQWQVDMHQTARELKAELDSKIAVVQVMLDMVTQERQRLDEAVARAEQLGLSGYRAPLEELDGLATEYLNGGDLPDAERLDRLNAARVAAPSQLDKHRQKIHALADQGRSSTAIAHELGVPLGDVELLLSLPAGCRL